MSREVVPTDVLGALLDDVVPLSLAQASIGTDSATGVVPLCFRIIGPLDLVSLHQAMVTVVDRHEPLRLRLVRRDDGSIGQRFLPTGEPFELRHDTACDETTGWEVGSAVALDLFHDGPIHASVRHFGTDRLLLTVVLSRLSCDDASAAIFVRELWWSYVAIVAGIAPSTVLLPVRRTFTDCVLREAAAGRALTSQQQAFWSETLRGASRTVVPACGSARRRGESPQHMPPGVRLRSEEHFRLDSAGAASLVGCARVAQVPHLAVVITGTALGMALFGGETDVTFGYVTPGRDGPGMENLIGCFSRLFFVRIEVDEDASLRQLLHSATRAWSDGERCSRRPYSPERMLRAFDDGASDLYEFTSIRHGVVVHDASAAAPGDPFRRCPVALPAGLDVGVSGGRPEGPGPADHLVVDIRHDDGALVFSARYDPEVVDPACVGALFESIQAVFRSIDAAGLDVAVGALGWHGDTHYSSPSVPGRSMGTDHPAPARLLPLRTQSSPR